jgi:hypothetical protein
MKSTLVANGKLLTRKSQPLSEMSAISAMTKFRAEQSLVFLYFNWTIMWRAHVRPEANPPPHSQVVLRAPDKSRMRDFLFLAHASTAVTVLFSQLSYLVEAGQNSRSSLLSMPCASPLKNGLHRNSLISLAEDD